MKFQTVLPILAAATAATVMAQAPAAPKSGPALRSVNQTFYTDRTELLAEWRPIVAAENTRFSAHLTKVGDRFQAYSAAKVTLTLTVDGSVVEAKVEAPERPGVFRLPFTAPKVGKGRIVVEVVADGPAERFVLEDVPVYASVQDAMAKQTPAETGLISYSKETQWDSDYASATVGKALTVPAAAVVQEEGKSYVYVQRTPERFELRVVQTGKRTGDLLQIAGGLRDGERIVVAGADKMPRK